jgi:hypothetical protein
LATGEAVPKPYSEWVASQTSVIASKTRPLKRSTQRRIACAKERLIWLSNRWKRRLISLKSRLLPKKQVPQSRGVRPFHLVQRNLMIKLKCYNIKTNKISQNDYMISNYNPKLLGI